MIHGSVQRPAEQSPLFTARARILSTLAVAALFAFMAIRQQHFVDRYAVNVMYYDEWDFYRPFAGATLWQDFDHQHGPHRMGVGLPIQRELAKRSHFNSRWSAFAVSDLLMLAAALAIPLARLCGVTHPLALLPIPLIFLNRSQYEQFLAAADISHAAMPMLLLMLLCLCWFIRFAWLRWLLVVVLSFLTMFTGYGIFVGVVVPVVMLIELVQSARCADRVRSAIAASAMLLMAGAWALFLHGYDLAAAIATGGAGLARQPVSQRIFLVAGILAHDLAIRGGTKMVLGAGMLAALVLLSLCILHTSRLLRGGITACASSAVIFCLAAFALIYTANAGAGRTAGGWRGAANTSRYVTLLIPAQLAISLQLATGSNKQRALVLTLALAAWLSYGATVLNRSEWAEVNHLHNGLIAWRDAYFRLHDEAKADAAAHFLIYPAPGAITDRLRYLEQHRLNFFYQAPRKPAHAPSRPD